MARCCTGNNQTAIQGGSHLLVTGTGTPQNPFVLVGDIALGVTDTTTFNLTLVGDGTQADPWVLSVDWASTAKLDSLPDVNAPSPSNGHVLGFDMATEKWTNRAPTTASAGSVTHNASLSGDGSVGSPLAVAHATGAFTSTAGTGIDLTSAAKNQMVRRFADDTARSAASPAPVLNSFSALDSNPGVIDYWDGAAWTPLVDDVTYDLDDEFLQMSGPYTAGAPLRMMVRQVDTTTDATGVFQVLTDTQLVGRGGVLSAMFQETGSTGYKAVLFGDVNQVLATAYRLGDDGSPLGVTPVTGVVTAWVY